MDGLASRWQEARSREAYRGRQKWLMMKEGASEEQGARSKEEKRWMRKSLKLWLGVGAVMTMDESSQHWPASLRWKPTQPTQPTSLAAPPPKVLAARCQLRVRWEGWMPQGLCSWRQSLVLCAAPPAAPPACYRNGKKWGSGPARPSLNRCEGATSSLRAAAHPPLFSDLHHKSPCV